MGAWAVIGGYWLVPLSDSVQVRLCQLFDVSPPLISQYLSHSEPAQLTVSLTLTFKLLDFLAILSIVIVPPLTISFKSFKNKVKNPITPWVSGIFLCMV